MRFSYVVLAIIRNRAEREETVRWTVLAKEPGGGVAIVLYIPFLLNP